MAGWLHGVCGCMLIHGFSLSLFCNFCRTQPNSEKVGHMGHALMH